MNLPRIGRNLTFLAGSVVGGLALAFVLVLWRPQLLRPEAHTAPAPGTPTASPATGTPALPSVPAPVHAEPSAVEPRAVTSYATAVHRAAPAVVNISTARVVTERVLPSVFGQMFGDLQPLYRDRVERALGSGVIVDASGRIITNNHVVANADEIMVQLADGRVARATVVGRDPDTDLALLSVKLEHLPVMPLGDSNQLQVGDVVLAIGNPLGLSQTVTHGIVSFRGRQQLGVATFEDFIQTDAAINAGNSGGALINTNGDLIGINTAVLNKGNGDISVEGIGFAIPVNLVRGVMRELLAHGHVIRGWVGILPRDVDDNQAHQLGLARGGVLIAAMYRNSPAVDGGLQIGDIVLAVNGQHVGNAHEALSLIAAQAPGSQVRVRLVRGQEEIERQLHVAERPTSPVQGA